MELIESFVRNPVKVTVGILLVALFGIISLLDMPKQLTPEVEVPTIEVETRWPGASPQEVEREIVQEQEEQLKSVEGLTKFTSESLDSMGRVTMEFLVGTDMDQALLKVNSRLQQVREYPEDADEPVISTSSASDRPIAWFILNVRPPGAEQYTEFQKQHPALHDVVERVKLTENPGLALLRLRALAEQHPEARVLLPPPIDVPKLRRFAEDVLEARFERVEGVSNSNVLGGLEDEMQVIIDPQKLAARGLTIEDVRVALRSQNKDTSGGDFWETKRRWVVRTLGQFRSPEQVESQLLATRDGAPVYVRDVAHVELGYKKPDGVVRRFGTSTIAVNASRETGANVLEVMDGLKEAARELNDGILKRRNLELAQVYDETDYIHSSIGLVQQNIFVGGALTMIVLMIFLHRSVRTVLVTPLIAATAVAAAYVSPWFFVVSMILIVGAGFWFARGALVVGLAIPVSIVGTFLMLGIMHRSLNVISLAGMAFAVGMLVDNAVVVLENVYRHYHGGDQPFVAAVRGTAEVWGAVVASTLTTIAVFLPVVFVQEEAGQLFRDIALAISSAVGLSLIVSVTLIPMASARLFHARREEEPGAEGEPAPHAFTPPQNGENGDGHLEGPVVPGAPASRLTSSVSQALVMPLEAFGNWFVATVVGINTWVLRTTPRRLAVAAVLLGSSLGISWLLWPKVEYLPVGNRNLVLGIVLPPAGYNIDQLMELGLQVEEELRPYWDVEPGSKVSTVDPSVPALADFFFVARNRQVFLGVRSANPLTVAKLIPVIKAVEAKLPGTIMVAKQSSLFERGLTAGRTVDVEITGPDLPRLIELGRQVFGMTKALIPAAQVLPTPSLELSSPEVHVTPKLLQSAEMGVTASDLGYTVDALVDGAYAGDYYLGGDKIDLTIKGQELFANKTQDVESLPIATPIGQLVPLGALANVALSSGPEQINHRDRQRTITIQVTPPEGMALEDAMDTIRAKIVAPLMESGQLDKGYMVNLSGTADKLQATWGALRSNVLLALLITYLLMAALFESWLYPFVIILTVPLGAVGGIMGLALLNLFVTQQLDVLTMLGFVILIGTVVNNPILIVHQSLNHMREDEMSPLEAILESVRTRIRPIFMTTITTVLGLLPLVVLQGAGNELYRGLGAVVLGGLMVSTIFTLFLVPTAFSLTMEAKGRVLGLVRHQATPETQAETDEFIHRMTAK